MEIKVGIFSINGNWVLTLSETNIKSRPISGTSRQDVINKLEYDGDSYISVPGAKFIFIDGEQPKVRIV